MPAIRPMSDRDPHPLGWIDEKLGVLEARGLRRRRFPRDGMCGPVIERDGRQLVNFGANDYLGLAGDRRLADAAAKALEATGWGSGASPLISGYTTWHERLERRLAEFLGVEAAMLFSSGYAANVGAIAALVGQDDTIFSDERNHASIIDGCRLSRAEVHVYRHGDASHLAELLASTSSRGRRLIVTDTVFSMDGDTAPLSEIVPLAVRFGAMLMIDEAHATGVFGPGGRGLAEQLGVECGVHVHLGTLSKALGCGGGFVAGSQRLIEWLTNRARSYVFSTAHPAANCAAALAALDIIRDEPARRQRLLNMARQLRAELRQQGWNVGAATTQIVPVLVGDAERTMALSEALKEDGLFVPGIRPPTVPLGQSQLRISLSATHTEEQLAHLVASLARRPLAAPQSPPPSAQQL